MKVILLRKVPGLGDIDDVKEVAEGYARNFLFPKHLAAQASSQATRDVDTRREKEKRIAEQDLHEQQALAGRIDGLEAELKERANDRGVLYAAVTAQKLAQALQRLGYKVDPKQIFMKPLKELGNHSVHIKFRHGLEAEITVLVNPLN